jgi:starch-binding outer membrane protein, SusD/RagB family
MQQQSKCKKYGTCMITDLSDAISERCTSPIIPNKKETIMKNIIFCKIWIIILISFLSACSEDFLEIPILVNQSAENFDPATAVTASYNISTNATTNAYPNMRWFNWQTFIQGDAISDDAFKSGSGEEDQPGLRRLELFEATAGNPQATGFWQMQYIKIYYMNWAISGIEQNRGITEELRARYLGEVKFLRALNYFMLNRIFGGVTPIFALGMDSRTPRATEAEIYKKLEEELQYCISVLPERYPSSDLGRVTKGAARGLLAKVYLYQQKNQECFNQTQAIIQSGVYHLETDYANLWRRGLPQNRNEHGPESVFEFTLAGNPERSNAADWARSMRPRMPIFGITDGWGLNNPTLDLLDEFEMGDPRIISTFLFHGDSMMTPAGDALFAVDAVNHPTNHHRMFNHKVVRKLTDNPEFAENTGENLIILRYADILLMHAEAANEIGNTAEALEKLNMVRQRARNSIRTDYRREYINLNGVVNYTGPQRQFISYDWNAVNTSELLPDVTVGGKQDLRHAIWHERRVEFAMEGERFYDLVRQGRVEPNRAGNIMHAFANKWNTDKGRFFEDGKHELFPIPQAEIDLLGIDLMPQNPGY